MRVYHWLLGFLALSGCSVELDTEHIQAELKQSIALSDKDIEVLPTFEVMQNSDQIKHVKRDPFRSQSSQTGINWAAKKRTSKPDLTRDKSPLEHFDLDSLSISGLIQDQQKEWVLVIDPVGQLSRLAVGDRVGKNYGEVIELNHDGFVVLEKLMDGHGRWYSHHRTIFKDEKNEE